MKKMLFNMILHRPAQIPKITEHKKLFSMHFTLKN